MKIDYELLIIGIIIGLFFLKTQEGFGRSVGQSCSKSRGNRCNFGLKCIDGRCGSEKKIDKYDQRQENKDARLERKQTRAEKLGMGAYIGIGIGVAVCIGVIMMLRSKAR